jgi:hypothetical protein
MGTSSKYPGPRGGQWTEANLRLGIWVSNIERKTAMTVGSAADRSGDAEGVTRKSDQTARELADRYRAALAAELVGDPAAFGLRDALRTAGSRLVDTLESLRAGEPGWLNAEEKSAQAREDAFVRGFASQVAGSGGLVCDAAVRRAAVASAQAILKTPGPLQDAIRLGKPIEGAWISDELFCLVFQLFFKDALAQFVTVIVAGKVRLAFPLLHTVDPAGKIADWVGQQAAACIPDPCQKGSALADRPSLADLARGLVGESVDRALGIPVTIPGSAA